MTPEQLADAVRELYGWDLAECVVIPTSRDRVRVAEPTDVVTFWQYTEACRRPPIDPVACVEIELQQVAGVPFPIGGRRIGDTNYVVYKRIG